MSRQSKGSVGRLVPFEYEMVGSILLISLTPKDKSQVQRMEL